MYIYKANIVKVHFKKADMALNLFHIFTQINLVK